MPHITFYIVQTNKNDFSPLYWFPFLKIDVFLVTSERLFVPINIPNSWDSHPFVISFVPKMLCVTLEFSVNWCNNEEKNKCILIIENDTTIIYIPEWCLI